MGDAVDLREVFKQKKLNATVLSALATIHTLCGQVKERQHTARQLHTRLHQVFLRATAHAGTPCDGMLHSPRRLAAFTSLLDALQVTLKRHIKLHTNVIRRVLHHRLFSLQLCSIHHQLTAFLKESRLDLGGFPVEWRSAFEVALRQDEKTLYETVTTVVKSTSFLSKEYVNLATQQQLEVLLNVRVERSRSIDLSPVLKDCLKTIYGRLVRLFGWDLSETSRRVPGWFITMTSVEFSASRDLLTRTKPTYRAEIALEERGGFKRHLVVLKCFSGTTRADSHIDDTLQVVEEFMRIFRDIDHPHVLRLRGANYVSGAPFVVRDYATLGTLGGHIARLRHAQSKKNQFDESLVWRLLADVCDGLVYIHTKSRGVPHGGLKGFNLLVNHRGHACIADMGVRSLRRTLHTVQTIDDHDYARWMAPELIATVAASPTIESDVYAFGMCIVEVLTGQSPWAGCNLSRVEDIKRADPSALPPQPSGISGAAWKLIQRMCTADPAKRLPLDRVYEALVQLARDKNSYHQPIPESTMSMINVDEYHDARDESDPDAAVDDGACEFETESVSSYKSTIEYAGTQDVSVSVAALKIGGSEDATTDEAGSSEMSSAFLPAVKNTFSEFKTEDYNGMDSTYDSRAIDAQYQVPIGLQTNGQMKDAIEYLADHIDSSPQALLPHLQLLRAFAQEEAQSIQESGGIRVLTALLTKQRDPEVRTTTLEIYSSLLAADHMSIAEAMVDQGIVAQMFERLMDKTTASVDQVNTCVSLLLDLMGQTDQAKREVGSKKEYVAILEKNENVHHRLLTEIKSVLARFKQMEGNELLKEGFYALAIPKFTEAIQLDRRRGIYYADRSLAYCHARRYHEAAEDAERCMRYNPFDVQGYLRYGIAMRHMHKYSEALAALRKGYQVNPNSPQLTLVMGEVQELYNKHKTLS